MPKLTDPLVRNLPFPERSNRIHYDSDVKGFGIRVTSAGAKSFVLNYRTREGKERRYTIGNSLEWTAKAAREEAKSLKLRVDCGIDPMAIIDAGRNAKTVTELWERFKKEHFPKLRPGTQRDYDGIATKNIQPAIGTKQLRELTFSDIDALHRKITKRGAAYQANRTVALLSKMFAMGIRWGWQTDNLAKGIERNQEVKRNRYLSGTELAHLTTALLKHRDQQAANIIRLLLLTGARRGEVLNARWEQIDLQSGIWTKPGAATKQKNEHRVPLSTPARQLLSVLKEAPDAHSDYVFPGRFGFAPRNDIKKNWKAICRAAFIDGVRIHDLRHTYASVLASSGLSLPIIGALLGHTQPATTARYAHLFDDPLRAATEKAGAIVMPIVKEEDILPIRAGDAE